MEKPELTPEIKEKLIAWYQIEKYPHGDEYNCYVNAKGQFVVYHVNDYPMQHSKGRSCILTNEEFAYAMTRPLTEFELMEKFWYPKTLDERQVLCDKYHKDKLARCLRQDDLINIFKSELNN